MCSKEHICTNAGYLWVVYVGIFSNIYVPEQEAAAAAEKNAFSCVEFCSKAKQSARTRRWMFVVTAFLVERWTLLPDGQQWDDFVFVGDEKQSMWREPPVALSVAAAAANRKQSTSRRWHRGLEWTFDSRAWHTCSFINKPTWLEILLSSSH